jgi:hypothetical protein
VRRRLRCAAGSDTRVRAAIANGQRPIVPASGTWTSEWCVLTRPLTSALTPHSSVSGSWPGITLAVVVGDCGEDVWAARKMASDCDGAVAAARHPAARRPRRSGGRDTARSDRLAGTTACPRGMSTPQREHRRKQARHFYAPRPRCARSRSPSGGPSRTSARWAIAPRARPHAHWHSRAPRAGCPRRSQRRWARGLRPSSRLPPTGAARAAVSAWTGVLGGAGGSVGGADPGWVGRQERIRHISWCDCVRAVFTLPRRRGGGGPR